MENSFFGKPFDYWLELDRDAKKNNYEELVLENAKLRAKVSYYEQVFNSLNKWRAAIDV